MRRRLLTLALSMVFCTATAAEAQVSFGLEAPGVSIGINMPTYPTLVRVPNYPVYYDPQVNANYFFYDGLFWVFAGDTWYASTWYDGPWEAVAPDAVPYFILRIPVRYYREPPSFFHGWRADGPPRWGDHWGHDWEAKRAGWDQWNHNAVPAPAPLPVYQRQYSGDRYPRAPQQQQALVAQHYHYQPKDAVTRQAFQQHGTPSPSRAEAPAHAAAQPTPHAPAATRTAQPRAPQPPTATAPHAPSRDAEARAAQAEHKAPAPRQQAAESRSTRTPQVAHQPEPSAQPKGTAQANTAQQRAPQRVERAQPPAREAQVAHEAPGGPPARAAAGAHPAPAQPQAKAAPNEARQGNGQAHPDREDKARPQQQDNADRKNEQHG